MYQDTSPHVLVEMLQLNGSFSSPELLSGENQSYFSWFP